MDNKDKFDVLTFLYGLIAGWVSLLLIYYALGVIS